MTSNKWDAVYLKLRHELEDESKAAQIVANFDADYNSFEAYINDLCRQYASKGVTQLIQDKLSPFFNHLQSFGKAVTSATSSNQTAGFVWAGAQAIIECVCRFSNQIENTFEQLANFYKAIPLFEEYIDMFPNDKRLETVLRDLYDDYGQFCILTIKFTMKRPVINVLQNLWSSKAPRKLRQVETNFTKHKFEFEDYTKLAFRKHVIPTSPRAPPKLPPNTITKRHTKYFSGGDTLKILHSQIQESRPSLASEPVSCVLHGMGGIGKTQLAVEYYFTYQDQYQCHFWVAAEDPTTLRESFNQIASKVFDPMPAPQDTVDKVRAWLESTELRWLLIFDNVEDWDSIKRFFPNASKSHSVIMLTTQIEDLKHWTTFSHAVKSLDTETGAKLLLKFVYSDGETKFLTQEEEDSARYLSEMFGGLPLAMAHIGGFVSQKHGSLSKYRDLADRRFASTWKGKPSTVQEYEKRLESVFDIALTELAEHNPTARNIIDIMAFLNPDNIPESMLWRNLQNKSQEEPQLYAEDQLEEMTPHLVKRGLVSREENVDGTASFSIHRTLQHALLLKLDELPLQREVVFNQAWLLVRQVLPETSSTQTPDERLWPQLERATPHVLRLCRVFLSSSRNKLPNTFQVAKMFYDAGFHTWEQWNPITRDGVMLLGAAEGIIQGLGDDTEGKLQADIHSIMAMFLDQVGISKRTEAAERRKKAIRIRRNILDLEIAQHQLDPLHPINPVTEQLYYNALNDEGRSLLQSNLFQEAGKAFDLCYIKYPDWGDEDTIPFEYAKYYHNMSYVHMYRKDYREALRLARLGVNLTEKKGRTGRYWWFRYDLACIELQSGDLASALASHLEILEARQKICGPDSEMTIESHYTVGAMHHHLGNLELAEKSIRESIEKAERIRWHEEAVGRAYLHLAQILRERNTMLAEAAELETKARKLLHKYLALDHPAYLKGVKDELALFDNMQPVFDGRFTGRNLLKYIQEHHL